jgi:hypothetical protein
MQSIAVIGELGEAELHRDPTGALKPCFGGVNVKGEALGFPLGCYLAVCDESVQAYRNLSWLCLVGFGNLYFKYSVPIGRFDLIVFHGLRQVEGSRKFARNPLDPVVVDAVRRLF